MQVTVNFLLSGTALVIGHDNRTDEVAHTKDYHFGVENVCKVTSNIKGAMS